MPPIPTPNLLRFLDDYSGETFGKLSYFRTDERRKIRLNLLEVVEKEDLGLAIDIEFPDWHPLHILNPHFDQPPARENNPYTHLKNPRRFTAGAFFSSHSQESFDWAVRYIESFNREIQNPFKYCIWELEKGWKKGYRPFLISVKWKYLTQHKFINDMNGLVSDQTADFLLDGFINRFNEIPAKYWNHSALTLKYDLGLSFLSEEKGSHLIFEWEKERKRRAEKKTV